MWFSKITCRGVSLITGWKNTVARACRMEDLDVVIVGGGAAGIAAAARLLDRRLEKIVILEAEERLGGRIHTIQLGDDVVELGAQWVHGEVGNVVFNIANEYDLLSNNSIDIIDTPYIDSSGKVVEAELAEKFIGILFIIHKEGDTLLKDFKGSLGEYYNEMYQSKVEEEFEDSHSGLGRYFLDWFQKFENSIDGSDSWFETSGHGLTEYWECDGNLMLSWKSGGYKKLFDILLKKIPDDNPLPIEDKIQYKKEVKLVTWGNMPKGKTDKVIVECTDGSSYLANHVIVTVSLGVLKEKANTLFYPALPLYKLNAIKGLGFGTVNKIFLKFLHRWWPKEHSGFSLLWTDEDVHNFNSTRNTGEGVDGKHWMKDVFGFYAVDNQPLTLCGWIVGPASRNMENISDEQVIEGCIELLERFVGRAYNVSVPRPELMKRSQWSSNPHFRGSYSFRSMESEALGVKAAQLAEPLIADKKKPVLLFAGEATHEHYYSTVHGAVETGRREADRILAYYGYAKSSL